MKNSKIRSGLNFLLLFTFTAIVLYFSLKDNYEMIIKQITSMNIFFILISFCLLFLYWLFRIITVHNLALHFNSNYSFKNAVYLVLETTFFHAVTPFSSGGQPYEIYSLTKSDIKLTDATNVSIQNFIVYQLALVILGVIAIFSNQLLHLFPSNSLLQKLVTLGFLINTLVTVFLFLISMGSRVNQKILNSLIRFLGKIHIIKNTDEVLNSTSKYLSDFHSGAKTLFRDKLNFVKLVCLQFASLCSLYLIPFFLFKATGNTHECNAFYAIITSAYVMLIGSFVPIPGGTGGLEYGFVTFYSNFFPNNLVTAVMLVWRFVTYYFGMILGGIILTFRKRK